MRVDKMILIISLVIWLVCCIDAHTINELCLVLHAITTAVCQFYLAVLSVRRATLHIAIAAHLSFTADLLQDPRKIAVHFLEGVCEACQSVPHLLGAVVSLGVVVSHFLQGVLFLVPSTLRSLQRLLSADSHEMDKWERERRQAKKDARELSAHIKYFSIYCQDPIKTLRY